MVDREEDRPKEHAICSFSKPDVMLFAFQVSAHFHSGLCEFTKSYLPMGKPQFVDCDSNWFTGIYNA